MEKIVLFNEKIIFILIVWSNTVSSRLTLNQNGLKSRYLISSWVIHIRMTQNENDLKKLTTFSCSWSHNSNKCPAEYLHIITHNDKFCIILLCCARLSEYTSLDIRFRTNRASNRYGSRPVISQRVLFRAWFPLDPIFYHKYNLSQKSSLSRMYENSSSKLPRFGNIQSKRARGRLVVNNLYGWFKAMGSQ